jgi:maltooligosyltrehalose trehalohydrolase
VDRRLPLGAVYRGRGRCSFLVWAPDVAKVELRILSPPGRLVRLQRRARGYHYGVLDGIEPDALYVFRLDGLIERPDPASRCQPRGPCGPSCVVDSRFTWKDGDWSGLPLVDYILHEGPDSPVPFDEIAARLDRTKSLGANVLAIRLDSPQPRRSAGFHFAVPLQRGGAPGLKRLVDACHRQGLAVLLGLPLFEPGLEGDPFAAFGPYFTGPESRIHLDVPRSDEVRRYFIESALHWFRKFHVDALDVGSVDGLVDPSPTPLLEEMARSVHLEAERIARPLHLVARSDRNDPRLIRRCEDGGIGLDALWNPDFSLALKGVLTRGHTPESPDFGKLEHLKKAFLEGFVCSGDYSFPRQRRHGRSSRTIPGERFLVCCPLPANAQQGANSVMEEQKLIGSALLLSPFGPLISFGPAENSHCASALASYFSELARLRKELRAMGLLDKQRMGVLGYEREKILLARYWKDEGDILVLFNFDAKRSTGSIPFPGGAWSLRLDSADRGWHGPGSSLPRLLQGDGGDIPLSLAALSCAVYIKQR